MKPKKQIEQSLRDYAHSVTPYVLPSILCSSGPQVDMVPFSKKKHHRTWSILLPFTACFALVLVITLFWPYWQEKFLPQSAGGAGSPTALHALEGAYEGQRGVNAAGISSDSSAFSSPASAVSSEESSTYMDGCAALEKRFNEVLNPVSVRWEDTQNSDYPRVLYVQSEGQEWSVYASQAFVNENIQLDELEQVEYLVQPQQKITSEEKEYCKVTILINDVSFDLQVEEQYLPSLEKVLE